MEASKVTISAATLAEAQKPIGRKGGQRLKREAIMAYIRKHPAGQLIRMHDMALASGFTQRNAGSVGQFLNAMERDKLITMDGIPKSKWRHFTVIGDVTTTAIVPAAAPEIAPTPPQGREIHTGRVCQGIRVVHRQRQPA